MRHQYSYGHNSDHNVLAGLHIPEGDVMVNITSQEARAIEDDLMAGAEFDQPQEYLVGIHNYNRYGGYHSFPTSINKQYSSQYSSPSSTVSASSSIAFPSAASSSFAFPSAVTVPVARRSSPSSPPGFSRHQVHAVQQPSVLANPIVQVPEVLEFKRERVRRAEVPMVQVPPTQILGIQRKTHESPAGGRAHMLG